MVTPRRASTRDGERGAHGRRVLGDHHADLQLVQPLAGHRHADEAAPVRGHEVDRLRRRLVGGHDQVALVLAVLVVDDQQEIRPWRISSMASSIVTNALMSSPSAASERCRYLPITSISRFTAWPRASVPNVVTASVCGITITSNAVSLERRHREAHAVHRHRSLRDQQRSQLRPWQRDPHPRASILHGSRPPRFRCRPRDPGPGGRRARAPKRSGRSRFTASPAVSRPERRARQRLRAHLEGEPVGPPVDHREADPVDRHAGAELAALERDACGRPRAARRRRALDSRRTPASSSTIPVNIG